MNIANNFFGIVSILAICSCASIPQHTYAEESKPNKNNIKPIVGSKIKPTKLGGNQMIYNLPSSNGLGFNNLDDYLRHLKKQSTRDITYYELIAPDKYKRISRTPNLTGEKDTFTRKELMEKFGLSK